MSCLVPQAVVKSDPAGPIESQGSAEWADASRNEAVWFGRALQKGKHNVCPTIQTQRLISLFLAEGVKSPLLSQPWLWKIRSLLNVGDMVGCMLYGIFYIFMALPPPPLSVSFPDVVTEASSLSGRMLIIIVGQ